jgi:undecaprenyl-diphosphatase
MDFLITVTAKYLYIVIVLIAAVYWLTLPNKQKIRVLIFGAIAAAIAYALVKLGGAVFYDPRPFVTDHLTPLYPHAPDNGFPSDHTALTASIAVTIYFVSKKLGIGLMILAVLVGVSRVLAHIHNPLDVLGSLLFALIGGVVAYYLTPKITASISKGDDEKVETEAKE